MDADYILKQVIIPGMRRLYENFDVFELEVRAILEDKFDEIKPRFNYYQRFINEWLELDDLRKERFINTFKNDEQINPIVKQDNKYYYTDCKDFFRVRELMIRMSDEFLNLIGSKETNPINFGKQLNDLGISRKQIRLENGRKWVYLVPKN
jgi:hypothetical protein